MEYKITFVEGDTINKQKTISAESINSALVVFFEQFPEADVQKVEVVNETV